MHLLGDGHLDAHRASQPHRGVCGENTFCNHAVHSSNDVPQIAAVAELDTDTAITRESAGAGQYKIAESSQPCHGFGTATTRHDQAGDLRQAARDECGNAVVAEIESVTDACRNGHDILQ